MAIVEADVLLWYDIDEGSGTTLDNAEGTASRDGTHVGCDWVTGGPTNIPDALDFVPGSNDYVTLNNTFTELLGAKDNDFSFAYCMKYDASVGASSYLVNDWGGSGHRSLYVRVMSDSDVEVYISDNGTASELQIDYTTGASTSAYQWWVVTRSGNDMTLILDGTQVGSNTGSFSFPSSTSDIHFGLNPAHNDTNFDGKLAQMIVLDRVITASEASDIYNAGDGDTYADFFGGGPTATPFSQAVVIM